MVIVQSFIVLKYRDGRSTSGWCRCSRRSQNFLNGVEPRIGRAAARGVSPFAYNWHDETREVNREDGAETHDPPDPPLAVE